MAWGIALLPWNVTLQVLLLPACLYLLVGKVLPVDFGPLAFSVGLYLAAPFLLSAILRRAIISTLGVDYAAGTRSGRCEFMRIKSRVNNPH